MILILPGVEGRQDTSVYHHSGPVYLPFQLPNLALSSRFLLWCSGATFLIDLEVATTPPKERIQTKENILFNLKRECFNFKNFHVIFVRCLHLLGLFFLNYLCAIASGKWITRWGSVHSIKPV